MHLQGTGEPAVEHLGSLAEVGLKLSGKCISGAVDAIGHMMQDSGISAMGAKANLPLRTL